MTNQKDLDENLDDLIISPLQISYEKDGETFQVKIYRSPYETSWTLEILSNLGHSNVLGVGFYSDWHAFEEARMIIGEYIDVSHIRITPSDE